MYVDRGFISRDMPKLDAWLHYRPHRRLLDQRGRAALVPRVCFAPAQDGQPPRLADARESIAELRYYREAVMVADPGPTTDASREIAAKRVVGHTHAVLPPSRRRCATGR